MVTTGEMQDISIEHEIEWKLLNFSSLSCENGSSYTSPLFSFANESWCLMMYPNGDRINSTGYVSLYLRKKSTSRSIKLKLSLGLKSLNGKKDPEYHFTNIYKEAENGHGYGRFLLRSKLFNRKADLLPVDVITIFCNLKYSVSNETSKDIAVAKCSYCEKNVDAESLLLHQKKDKPIKCPDCSAVISIQSWCDHECQAQSADASEKIMYDLKTAMLSGDHSDVIVKVKEEEFRLHKVILATRNPYFDSMFKNDMKEKSTGIVTIADCEPEVFRSFVHFLYTGKVDKLSPENVCDLYEAADKYQEDQLKKECLHSMLNTLSVDSFCDYFVLALRHDEKELFQKAVEYFITKSKLIACSVKWQTFVKEYPIQANELFIKTLNHFVK